MIIDAHAHIFPRMAGRFARGAVRGLSYGKVQIGSESPFQAFAPCCKKVSSPPETLLAHMDWAGVDHAILLQNNFYGNQNAFVAAAVRRWPDRFTGAMYLDPWSTHAPTVFRRWQEWLPIVKLATDDRFGLFALHENASLADDCCGWLWPRMEQSRMTLTLDLGAIGSRSYETDVVASIADRHPKLKIVICHLAQPTVRDEKPPRLRRLWRDQIALAKRPNVWLDLSALPHKVGDEPFPWPCSGGWIREVVEGVGAKKLLWGTDYPALLTAGTYRQLLDQVSIHVSNISSRHLKAILGENARTAYSLRKT